MMRTEGGRHELKHFINRFDLQQLQLRLPYVMARDEHADAQGGYRIRSLYFDNYSDRALREKIDGVDNREKFRLRFYGDDTGFVRLEKKSKQGGMCFKQSSVISPEACRALMNGDIEALRAGGDSLQLELYAKMRTQLLRPKNIVDYRRDAFVCRAGNVRVTLDYDMRASCHVKDFLNTEYISIPLPDTAVLEVKYDHFLPEFIRGMVTLSGRQATAFSKYAAARIL
ncbi:MAG: polyphosphate polymerase domain-containing protein [Oscillospiraceae bacterium]|nr:polyphosphate polymerase domain-containing protein [Oscillospiraceae bacterium]